MDQAQTPNRVSSRQGEILDESCTTTTNSKIKTTFLIVSDTHSKEWIPNGTLFPAEPVDVAIHCGDLTERSTLAEFRQAIQVLKRVNAALKLVIPGNHDFTLDDEMFGRIYRRELTESNIWSEAYDAAPADYGHVGEARGLFSDQGLFGRFGKRDGDIHLLEKGEHTFVLKSGATLRVYADPCTPSADGEGGFKFKRDEGRGYDIRSDVDVVITHGPPRGKLDTNLRGQQVGCANLAAAIARAKPLMHCFGHIHEGWGSQLVTWDGGDIHTRDYVDSRAGVSLGRARTAGNSCTEAGICGSVSWLDENGGGERCEWWAPGRQTLFVNAALENNGHQTRGPSVVELDLPAARKRSWMESLKTLIRRYGA